MENGFFLSRQADRIKFGLWILFPILFATGRRFRTLNIKDLFTHEAVAIHVDFSIPGYRVAEVLSILKAQGKCPKSIIVDNGTEFTSKAMDVWAYQNNVELKFIQPGKPIQKCIHRIV